jgi:broad specificity phosphatase PhoE
MTALPEVYLARPGWDLLRDGCPGSAAVAVVGARADHAITRLRAVDEHVLLFSHGPFLRVLTVRWLGPPVRAARHFVLSTAALSILGYEHTRDAPALRLWNDTHHVVEKPGESLAESGTR